MKDSDFALKPRVLKKNTTKTKQKHIPMSIAKKGGVS